MPLTDEVLALAAAQAAQDRAMLARLVREGKVFRAATPPNELTRAIDDGDTHRARINLAIRPKRKRR